MRKLMWCVAPVIVAGAFWMGRVSAADKPQNRLFELRTYTANEGKFDALQARFRDHTCKLFEKHGMANVGYWAAGGKGENQLIYIISHASREAADQSWKAFGADPDWKAVVNASEANGKILAKPPERLYLASTAYSPSAAPAGGSHVYEQRTYTAAPGKLADLNARFRDHTLKLFEKHGMMNVG